MQCAPFAMDSGMAVAAALVRSWGYSYLTSGLRKLGSLPAVLQTLESTRVYSSTYESRNRMNRKGQGRIVGMGVLLCCKESKQSNGQNRALCVSIISRSRILCCKEARSGGGDDGVEEAAGKERGLTEKGEGGGRRGVRSSSCPERSL